jgi:hypothetical protein
MAVHICTSPSFTGSKTIRNGVIVEKDPPALIELLVSQSRFRLMVDVF